MAEYAKPIEVQGGPEARRGRPGLCVWISAGGKDLQLVHHEPDVLNARGDQRLQDPSLNLWKRPDREPPIRKFDLAGLVRVIDRDDDVAAAGEILDESGP